MEKKTILVTGGAGFIGTNLIFRLLKKGHNVICLDNLYTGSKKNINKYFDLFPNQFSFIFHDITTPFHCRCDEIYNLACPASPPFYQKKPIETMKTSVLGMLNMLELAHKNGAKILQASTSEVYGDPLEHPQSEKYWGNVNPIGIRSCYDEGKRAAETLCMDYHREHGLNIKIMRIFNTYGPYMNPKDGRVISNFINQILDNKPITVYGDGSQTRSFQYIDDLLDGMEKLMESERSFIGPVNLGTDFEFNMKELAETIKSLIPESKSEIIYKPLPGDDPKQRKSNSNLAFEKFGWKPKIGLKEGLSKTITYFRNIKKEDI